MLSITQVQVDGFDKNFSYLVVDEKTKRAALVDPCGKIERVFDEIKKEQLELQMIFVTHSHFDHHEKMGVALAHYPVSVYMHENAAGRIDVPKELARYVGHEDTIPLGEGVITVYYTPGHNDDSICFYISAEGAEDGVPKLITGDTLFVEGCGRTTPSGVEDLYKSLQFLKTLPDETEVFTGHDYGTVPTSTIGREKKVNKYFLAEDPGAFRSIRLPNH